MEEGEQGWHGRVEQCEDSDPVHIHWIFTTWDRSVWSVQGFKRLGFVAGAAAVLLVSYLPINLSVLSTVLSKRQCSISTAESGPRKV